VVHTDTIIDTRSQNNGLPHSRALQNWYCTWPTLREAKHFIITTTVLSFSRAQKLVSHTVVHCRIDVCTWPTL